MVKSFLQRKFSFSLSLSSLLLCAVVIAGIVTLLVRYRLLTKYSRLPPEETPDDKFGLQETFNDIPGIDIENEEEEDFLRAIKVFGYLDRDVYHRLTMSRETQKLQKGETINLDDIDGLAVVIDGAMQLISTKTQETLNEVAKAAPLTSLSRMLSLFTGATGPYTQEVVAIAQEPTTIIIVRSKAFQELLVDFPKASANIVQVLLFRWSQVTLRTSQHFLDLSDEMFSAELRLPQLSLPDWTLQAASMAIEGTLVIDPLPRRKLFSSPSTSSSRRNSFGSLTAETDQGVLRTVLAEALFKAIGFPVEDEQLIDAASSRLELLSYAPNTTIENKSGLMMVIDGEVDISCKGKRLHRVSPRRLCGYLETISSYSASLAYRTSSKFPKTIVAFLSKRSFENIAEADPYLWILAAKTLNGILTPALRQLDLALEWVSLRSGGTLFKEGKSADAIYFVLNGRLRASGTTHEYGQGSSVGQLEVLLGGDYSSTVVAVRETELARFPKMMFMSLAKEHPSLTFEMSRLVASTFEKRSRVNDDEAYTETQFRTVAVLSTSDDGSLPVQDFAQKLCSAFRSTGIKAVALTNAVILEYLGRYAFQRLGALKLKAYLADLEDRHDMLVYVADSSKEWTRTCIEQADCVLLLADASAKPVFGDAERMMLQSRTLSRAHLVFLHPDMYVPHGVVAKWMRYRPWINTHHHVELSFDGHVPGSHDDIVLTKTARRLQKLKKFTIDRLPGRRQKLLTVRNRQRLPYKSDFHRLARILSGRAVGLVLGGGGARGVAHIGVIRAIEDAGVPIDMIGGTSIGAFMGGLYAREYDITPLYSRARTFSQRFGQIWRILLDLTYPYMSWTTGHEFNRGIWKAFGDSRIEDFWIKYFTNTTNLTHSRMEVHKSGYSWRFVRASMSLAGLVPPIEEKGQMLLDGGYVDNLPVSEMKRMGARYIIAVDVGAVDDTTPQKYGDSLSGTWALINKFNPFSSTPNVPNIAEIQQRLTYVSSVKALEEARSEPSVMYLRPPIDPYGTLDFGKFEEIERVGREYAIKALKEEAVTCKLKQIPGLFPAEERPRLKFRRYSF